MSTRSRQSEPIRLTVLAHLLIHTNGIVNIKSIISNILYNILPSFTSYFDVDIQNSKLAEEEVSFSMIFSRRFKLYKHVIRIFFYLKSVKFESYPCIFHYKDDQT